MPRQPVQAPESFVDLSFPKAGVDTSSAFANQKAAKMPIGEYGKTTPLGINVRAFEPSTGRMRGGARSGLSKRVAQRVGGLSWIIQEVNGIVIEEEPVQITASGRVVTLVAVSQGEVYFANSGDTTWTLATNNTAFSPPLNFTGIVRSSVSNQLLYFVDGVHWCYFKPSTGTVETWSASAGSLPVDTDSNLPRLTCLWRGRTVLSGLLLDPQNWFMSAVNDPTDFDYSPVSTSPTQAVAGNNAPQGLIGDVITSLVPYTDDVLVVGGDHSIYLINGDPMAGGQIDLVSDTIGMAWGIPWAKDPYGNLFFVSNRCGIYTLIPGQSPIRISQQIEQYLQEIDTGGSTIRLLWNDHSQGLHVFVTSTSQAAAATHFFFEQRTGGWWKDKFTSKYMNPLCCVAFDGNLAADRVGLIGSWDGYVRAVDSAAETDDNVPIASEVVLGPIITKNLDRVLFKDLQTVLGEESNDVTFAIYVGSSAEKALSSTPVLTGTWKAGRNQVNQIRRSDHALYVKISGLRPWAFEQIRARVTGMGKVAARS